MHANILPTLEGRKRMTVGQVLRRIVRYYDDDERSIDQGDV